MIYKALWLNHVKIIQISGDSGANLHPTPGINDKNIWQRWFNHNRTNFLEPDKRSSKADFAMGYGNFRVPFFYLDSVNKSNALSLKSPFLLLKFYICAHEIWLSYTFIYMVVVASSIYPKPKGFHFRPQMFICSAKAPGITRHEAHTPHEATQVVGRTELWVKPS